MSRNQKALSDLDRRVMRHHDNNLSYEAIVIAEGINIQQARSIIRRLMRQGVLGPRRTKGVVPADLAREAKAKRAADRVRQQQCTERRRIAKADVREAMIRDAYVGRRYEDVRFR